MRRTTLLATAVAVLGLGLGCAAAGAGPAVAVGTGPAAAAPAAAGTPSHVTQVVKTNFPDPGFAKFGSTYYLYSTGDGFPAAKASAPQGPYTLLGATSPLGNYPSAWNAPAPKYGRHHWAPHVFQVTKNGAPLYVMYFTAWNVADGWDNDCIGVATSTSPTSGFTATGLRVCTAAGYEAIDPSMYLAGDGKRYLVYKKGRYSDPRFFSIVSVPVDAATGTTLVAGGERKQLAATTDADTMEAPSFVAHGGKVWMFVSRGSFSGDSYRTEVWSAPTFQDPGGFTRVTTLTMNNSSGQPFLSPGGATVIQDGSVTRVAFHATNASDTSLRQAYVGEIHWAADGTPFLY